MMSALLDFYSTSSLKKIVRSRYMYVVPFRHIILIPRQPVFALNPKCCLFSGEATNTNAITEFAKCVSPVRHDQQNVGIFAKD